MLNAILAPRDRPAGGPPLVRPRLRRWPTILSTCSALLLGAASLLAPGTAHAQTPTWQAALTPTLNGGSFSEVRATATDPTSGAVYVTGYFTGIANFGSTTLTSVGSRKVFVARYDPGPGTWAWATSVVGNGNSDSQGNGIATDGSGNVYVTGNFEDIITVAGQPLTGAGGNDVFVASYTGAGANRWAKSAGGSNLDTGTGIATDGSGNVYVTGFFNSSATVAGQTLTSAGSTDAFVASYTGTGANRWATSAGGSNIDQGNGIATDGSGNVYVTGSFITSATVAGQALTGAGQDVFVASYTGAGANRWANRAGGGNPDKGTGIATDGSGNVYVTGSIPGTGFVSGQPIFNANAFVASYTGAGAYRWAKSAGGSNDLGTGIATDGSGNVYVTGSFLGSTTVAGQALTSAGGQDAFVASYTGAGVNRWATSAGGSSDDQSHGIATDGSGNVYVTGYFNTSATFGSLTLTSTSTAGFLARLGSATPPTLTSLSPTSGPIGTSVTLTGTDFTGATGVSFNGTAATTFSVSNATTATATVPAGATSGPVTITTPGGPSGGVTFTVVNRAPTALALSNATVAENSGANAVVGTLSTTDPDAGNTFTYTLVSGAGATDNGLVNLSGNQLRITASPDFETKPSYAVRVRTTDQGGLFTEQAFTLTITDVPAPTLSGTGYVATIGSTLVLTGTGFVAGSTSVSFGGVAGTGVSVTSATSLSVTVPTGASSPLRVTTAEGPSNAVTFTTAGVVTAVVTGFNVDVVAEGTGPADSKTTDTFDSNANGTGGYVLKTTTYANGSGGTSTGGLPLSGTITSASTAGVTYQLAGYTGNNDLRLQAASTAALTLATPSAAADRVYVLAAAGSGPTTLPSVVVTFSDGSSQTFTNVQISDWYNDGNYAILGLGRVGRNGSVANSIDNDASNPRLYDVELVLSAANVGKRVASVTFSKNNGTDIFNAMAVSVRTLAPTLASLSPASGVVGSSVTLNGQNLTGATSVSFNGTVVSSASFTSASATSITLSVPTGVTTGPVTVTTPVGTSNGVTFTVAAPLVLTSRSPARNAIAAPRLANVVLGFDQSVNAATAGNVRVFSSQRGGQLVRGGNATASGATLTVDPAQDLKPGETVQVSVPATVQSSAGGTASPQTYQFTAATTASSGRFGTPVSYPAASGAFPIKVVSGDLDGDGNLDLVTTNYSDNTLGVYMGTGTGTLGTAMVFAVGTVPFGLALGDLNNDGRLDVVVGLGNFSSAAVLLNTGTSALLGAATTLNAGVAASHVALGDVNNDGNLDLLGAVTNNGSGTSVLVWPGTGTGTFGTPASYPTGTGPYSATLADFNNDGYLDILTPDYSSGSSGGTASVLLNQGNGTFAARVGYPLGATGNPRAALAADFNNDGNLDLAVGTETGAVSFLPGTGTGSFGAATVVPTGLLNDLAAGDVNGDGNLDLVSSRHVLLGNGTGGFTATVFTGSTSFGVALADYNGDGRLDLTTADGPNNTVRLWLGLPVPVPTLTGIAPASGVVGSSVTLNGTNLTGATTITFTGASNNTVSTGFTVNGAGTQITGLVVPGGAQTGNVTVTTAAGTSNGVTFTVAAPIAVTALSPARNAIAAPRPANVVLTFDQNVSAATAGNVRVFSAQRGGQLVRAGSATTTANGATLTVNPTTDFKPGETVQVSVPATVQSSAGGAAVPHVYQFTAAAGGTGSGRFVSGPTTPTGTSVIAFAVGDLNADGNLDLLTASSTQPSGLVSVHFGNGTGTFAAAAATVTVTRLPYGVSVADIDGDGDLDMLVVGAGAGGGVLSVRVNNGAGSFAGTSPLDVDMAIGGSGSSPSTISVGDVDADGDLDLLLDNRINSSATLFRNTGAGAFAAAAVPVGSASYGAALGDVDADGDLDLLTGTLSTTANLQLNDGTGSFGAATAVAVGDRSSRPTLADLNADGRLDLICGAPGPFSTSFSVCLSTGPGTFGAPTLLTSRSPSHPAAADVDADGDLDLVAVGFNGTDAHLYFNDGTGTFGAPVTSTVAGNSYDNLLADTDNDGDLDLITVGSNAGIYVSLNQAASPTLTSLSPTSGVVGTSVTLTGTNFTGATGVSFNGTAATTFSLTNATTATATVPTGATTGNVTVTTPSGTSNGVLFTVTNAPTALALAPQSVNENVVAGTAIGTFSTTDPDAGDTFTYTLVSGTGSTDNGAFSINGSGQLVITASPNFEAQPSYAIRVRSTDQGGLFTEQPFTITVTNVNEAPTNLTLSNAAIAENTGANAVVGTLSTTDPDANDTFTYTLVSGSGAADNALVNINGNELRITASPDFETKNFYFVRVRTTDAGGLFTEQPFTITLTNVNEAPTALNLSNTQVNENVPANSLVGTFSATDPGRPAPSVGGSGPAASPQVTNPFTYSLVSGAGSTDNASFTIPVGTNELRIVASPNYETQSSYGIRVRVTDNGSLFYEQTFTINVTDVNETPTNLTLSPQSIAENTGPNVTVGSLATTDVDGGDTFTYTLVSGAGSTDNALVNILGDAVRITADPDFETKSSYAIRVRTTDAGGLSFERAFTLTITDVLETPANDPPTNIFLSNADVAENAAGTPVGLLTTADGDVADTHTYTLVSGAGSSGNTAFTIVGSELRTAAGLDFETQNAYSVRIRSTDSGAGNLFVEKSFTITVTDAAEPLTVSTAASVPAGLYSTLTVTGTGTATLAGPVTVTTALTVQGGGVLQTNCQAITGAGTFTLAASATLDICHAQGLSTSGATGAVQLTGARTYSPHAHYVYSAGGAQVTGPGLPARVRSFTKAGAGTLTLSQPTSVRQHLSLTGAGNLVLNGNALTLLSTADTTAYLFNTSTGRVLGATATVQRYLSPAANAGLGYRHLAAPVTGSSVADLATPGFVPKVKATYNALPTPSLPAAQFPNVFGYDETHGGTDPAYAAFDYGYVSPLALTDALVPGRGQMVYIKGGLTPYFVGTLTQDDVTLSLTRTGTPGADPNNTKAGWSLLGNPFASLFDWELVSKPAALAGTMSVFRSTGPNAGAYLVRTNGVGGIANGIVAPGQAFFVRVDGPGPVSLTLPNSARVNATTNVAIQRPGTPVADTRPLVQLTLRAASASGTEQDAAFVYFEAGATADVDARYDGQRPAHNQGSVPTLSALTAAGEELAIDGLPETALTSGTTVELLLDLPTAGAYALTAAQLTNLAAGAALLDRKLGTRTALVAGATYAFTSAQAGLVAGRFALTVAPASTVTGTSDLSPLTAHLTVFPNPTSGGQVRALGVAAGQSVTLLDATGRVVRTTKAATEGAALDVAGLPAGVYVVRVGARTQRLVVE